MPYQTTPSAPVDDVDRYAILGNPVQHSQSPFIHAAFAAHTGQAMAYHRVLCPRGSFGDALQRFADSTSGLMDDRRNVQGPARGCNITVPFKFEVPALVTRLTDRARRAGAANTLRFDAEGWLADNTDGVGLCVDIERHAGVPLRGRRVLLIGAGGAAAGVLGALLDAGAGEVVVSNRTLAKAEELVNSHKDLAAGHGARLHAARLLDCGTAFDVVVNSSASSLQGDPVPVGPEVLRPGTLAIDLMYGPAANGFLDWARARRAVPRDGLGMLVEQAAEAFFLWRGVRPDTVPVLQSLRERLGAA